MTTTIARRSPLTNRARELMHAARAPESMPMGVFGLWRLYRITRQDCPLDDWERVGYDSLTVLRRLTMASMHEGGTVVMEDSMKELRRHLPILMAARGRVLVSGLGMGCVVRGLLSKPEVSHIDVVELDSSILDRVGPEFIGDQRVTLRHGDALKVAWPQSARWDFAWHDIWTEEGDGLPLHRLHLRLFRRFMKKVPRQGAWALPREAKRMLGWVLG